MNFLSLLRTKLASRLKKRTLIERNHLDPRLRALNRSAPLGVFVGVRVSPVEIPRGGSICPVFPHHRETDLLNNVPFTEYSPSHTHSYE